MRVSYEEKIADYFTHMSHGFLGLASRPKVESVSRLELGESNLNFLVTTREGKYVFRINMDAASEGKSGTEYRILRTLHPFGIAPVAFRFGKSKKPFGETFLILEYVEGIPLSTLEGDVISLASTDKLARLVAKIHCLDSKIKSGNLPTRGTTYESWIKSIRRDIQYIKQHRRNHSLMKDQFDRLLDDSFGRLQIAARQSSWPNIAAPGHGDICAQNIIVESGSGNLRLIDWENFGLWDPAAEITMIFEAFGLDFLSNREKRFLRIYGGMRRDESLDERIRDFRPLVRFEQLTWGVRHVFEIIDGQMGKAFVEATEMPKHLAFVRDCLNRCVKTGLIDTALTRKETPNIFPFVADLAS